MTNNAKRSGIQSYRDLEAWKVAYQLAREIYKITEKFPKSEQFGLTSQIRRCAVSVPSNIAEGFHRQNKLEKIQFYHIASGSTAELQTQILLASDAGYLVKTDQGKLMDLSMQSHRLTYGLIRSTRAWKT